MLHKKYTLLMLAMVLYASCRAQVVITYPELKTLDQLPLYTSLEEALKTPDKVYRLSLTGKGYLSFPEEVFRFKNLRWLDLSWKDKNGNKQRDYGEPKNHIRKIPARISNLKHLEYLKIAGNCLTEIPLEISQLTKIKYLSFSWNNLLHVPKEIGAIDSLAILYLAGNRLSNLPEEISQLENLAHISLGGNLFEHFPEVLLTRKKLRVLYFSDNPLKNVPEGIGNLTQLKYLYFSRCLLKTLPASVGKLKKLIGLSVLGNQIEYLPESIGQLTQLKELFVRNNLLNKLPKSIGKLKALKTLRAENNHIRYLPVSIGQLREIKKLSLSNNALKKLPQEITQLKTLTFFDLSKNDSLQINPMLFSWLSRNYNGLSPKIAGEIYQEELKKIKQQNKNEKERQRLRSEKKRQFYTLVFLGGVLLTIILLTWWLARGARRQRFAKHRIAEQAKVLHIKNKEIQNQAYHLKNSFEELKELQSFRQKMEAMVTHDLKNPLNVIIGLSEKTLNKQNKKTIHQAGLCMNSLIMNMLDVQKFKKASMNISPEPCSLLVLVHAAIEQVAWLAQSKNLAICSLVEPDTGVLADKELVIRLLVNLLNNAIKYSGQNQQIFIEATPTDSRQIKTIITDRGEGIPKQQLKYIFDEYHQANARNLGQSASTGLGLAFCKLTAEAHGGNIGVASVLGEGSSFWFTLLPTHKPVAGLHGKNARAPQIVSQDQDWQHRLTVQEKKQLAPYLPLLRKQMVFQFSGIEKILTQIDINESEGITTWMKTMQEAMEACNEEMYNQLINF